MKILMTGHTSPIGSVLFEHLSFTHQVTGISRQSGYDLNKFENMTKSGLDCCIYAYDCLLITNDLYSFMTLVCIHPGDNDTTGAIGGTWYGAMNGFDNFNIERFKELEFFKLFR